MKLFGTIDSFVESSDTSLKLGRLVANYEFLVALLRFGSFDQYHIFCPTLDNLRLLQSRLEATLDDSTLSRVILSHHFNLVDALRTHQYHAFHLGDWSWYLPKLAAIRQRIAKVPFPLTGTIHSLDGADIPQCIEALTDAPLGASDRIVCTSAAGRQVFSNLLAFHGRQDRLHPSLEVIPLGVPDTAFMLPDKASARTRLGIPDKAVNFLYIGRLSVATKADLGPLMYAIRQLIDEGRTLTRLTIAGGGSNSDVKNIETLISELGLRKAVLLRPNVSNIERAQLLAAADVFVSPVDNLQETFGISVVEAMAAGLPVVATDYDGYRDLVEDGVTGFRIPTLWQKPPDLLLHLRPILEQGLASLALSQSFIIDCSELAKSLRLLGESPELRRRLGEEGQRRARETFSWARIIPRYEEMWSELHRLTPPAATDAEPIPAPDDKVFEVFQHYPTTLLDDTVQLRASDRARAILAGKIPMPANYADTSLLISGTVLTTALTAIGDASAPLGKFRSLLAQHCGCDEDLVGYQLSWLLKYGLLEIARPSEQS